MPPRFYHARSIDGPAKSYTPTIQQTGLLTTDADRRTDGRRRRGASGRHRPRRRRTMSDKKFVDLSIGSTVGRFAPFPGTHLFDHKLTVRTRRLHGSSSYAVDLFCTYVRTLHDRRTEFTCASCRGGSLRMRWRRRRRRPDRFSFG